MQETKKVVRSKKTSSNDPNSSKASNPSKIPDAFEDDFGLSGQEMTVESGDSLPDGKVISMKAPLVRPILGASQVLVVRTGKDMVSKSIMFKPVGDGVQLVASDYDILISYRIPLEETNKSLVLDESVLVPYDSLWRMVSVSPGLLNLIKKEDAYYFGFFGGKLVFETYKFSDEAYTFPSSKDATFLGKIKVADFSSILRSLSKYATISPVPQDRIISFTSKGAYVAPFWSLAFSKGSFPSFCLSVKDARVLLPVLKGVLDDKSDLHVYKGTYDGIQRLIIKGKDFFFTTLYSEREPSPLFDTIMAKPVPDSSKVIKIDWEYLVRFCTLAKLPYMNGKIIFRSKDGVFNVVLPSRYGDQEFQIANLADQDFELAVQNSLLTSLLRSEKAPVGLYYDEGLYILLSSVSGFISKEMHDKEVDVQELMEEPLLDIDEDDEDEGRMLDVGEDDSFFDEH